ncbi:MAG: hypothetical protein CMF48_01940 [Legionellales bacterium]|nr:hypothetical protein [Legionellales bacterium]
MIQYLIANGQYRKAAEKLASISQQSSHSENVLVLGKFSSKPSCALATPDKQILHQAKEHFLTLVYNPLDKYKSDCPALIAAEGHSKREQFVSQFLPYANVKQEYSDSIAWAHTHANEIVSVYLDLINTVEQGFFNRIILTKERASVLRRGLSTTAKSHLSKALQSIFCQLDEGDVFYFAAMAFIRLVYNDYPAVEQSNQDERVLDAYDDIRQVYPSMARNLYQSLVRYLESGGSIADLSLYGPYAGSHQKALLDYLSEGRLARLRKSLLNRINALLVKPTSNLQNLKQEWMAHGKMISILQRLPGDSRYLFAMSVSKIVKRSRRAFEATLLPLAETDKLQSFEFRKIYQEKHAVLNNLLCLRLLGNEQTNEMLNIFMCKLTAMQRKLVMKLQPSQVSEQFIAISYDIIRLIGSKEQASHSDNLVHAWHVYCSDVASVMASGDDVISIKGLEKNVKQQATFDALDDYVAQLDARILGYFLHQFGLEKPFLEKASTLRQLISEANGLHSLNITEESLCDLLRNTQKPIRWHWHVPKVKDAEQLMVGLLISARAHQWVREYKQISHENIDVAPDKLCEILKGMAVELMHKFGVGHGRFTTHLASAIGAANDYFICPSGIESQEASEARIRH